MDDKYLQYKVKIFTKDNLFIEGVLLKTDKDKNLLVNDSEEFRNVKNYLKAPRRYLGLIMIPGKNIKYVEYLYKTIK